MKYKFKTDIYDPKSGQSYAQGKAYELTDDQATKYANIIEEAHTSDSKPTKKAKKKVSKKKVVKKTAKKVIR